MDYLYVWADGIHVNIRLGEAKLCVLVLVLVLVLVGVGVCADGRKELVALADGYRESAGSWADLLRDCKRRGMRPPVLAAGDGPLGFWAALREVFPATAEQRCWFHKTGNVLPRCRSPRTPARRRPSPRSGARPPAHRRRWRAGDVSLRFIYLLAIEDFARHAGHGDILREQIDHPRTAGPAR